MPRRTHIREFKLLIERQLSSGEKRPAQVCLEHAPSSLGYVPTAEFERAYAQGMRC